MLAAFRNFRFMRDVFETPYARLLKAYSAFVSADLHLEEHPNDPAARAAMDRAREQMRVAERENGLTSKPDSPNQGHQP